MKREKKPIVYHEMFKSVLAEYKSAQHSLQKMILLFDGTGPRSVEVGISMKCPHRRVVIHQGKMIKVCRKDVEPHRKVIHCPDCRINRCPLLGEAHNW